MSAPTWTHILIHHSAGPDSDSAETIAYRKYHKDVRGWQDIGYHFVVEKLAGEWVAIAGRSLRLAGAHCPGMNSRAIGVCLAGNFEESRPPAGQLERAARLVADLCHGLYIPVEQIERHLDHRQTACPGKHFDIEDFRSRVEEELR